MFGGWLLSIALIAPNLAWVLAPMRVPPIVARDHGLAHRAEGGARIAVFTLPWLYTFHRETLADRAALVVIVAALLAYYAAWVRYFRGGRRYRLLFAPAGPLPVPLALAPCVALAAGALALHSVPLAAATLLFALLHVRSSLRAAASCS